MGQFLLDWGTSVMGDAENRKAIALKSLVAPEVQTIVRSLNTHTRLHLIAFFEVNLYLSTFAYSLNVRLDYSLGY